MVIFCGLVIPTMEHLIKCRECKTLSERTNGQSEKRTRSINSVFTKLQVALNPHRMTPFLIRPNKAHNH